MNFNGCAGFSPVAKLSRAALSVGQTITRKAERRKLARQSSTWISPIVHSMAFEAVTTVSIMVNAAFIGYEIEWKLESYASQGCAQGVECESPSAIQRIGVAFNVFFALELLLRVAAGPFRFVFGKDKRWHLFDVVLVTLGILEIVFGTGSHFSQLRMLRIIRAARILRVVRVFKMFAVLRKMVNSLMNSFVSLFWLLILLVTVMYIFSIAFMQVTLFEMEDPQSDVLPQLKQLYGSTGTSMLTLFQAITGGMDWGDAMRPMLAIGWSWVAIFLGFIMFNTFAVMNVVTGVFVDQALEIAAGDRDELVESQLAEQLKLATDIELFFEEHFRDSDGLAKRSELLRVLQTPQAIAFLSTLGLDIHQGCLLELMDLLDPNHLGEIGVLDFIQCCLRVKGPAKSFDLLHVTSRIDMLFSHVEKIERKLCGGPATDVRVRRRKIPSLAPGTSSLAQQKSLQLLAGSSKA